LEDYNINKSNFPILYDNNATINLAKNVFLHFRAKHIEIKHHFIRDYVQKGIIIDLNFVSINNSLEDIFTKDLIEEWFNHMNLLGMTPVNEWLM